MILEFNKDAVQMLLQHSRQAAAWRHILRQAQDRLFASRYEGADHRKPGLWLVGDQGVYLMSNADPGLLRENSESHVVVYAEGLNPEVDDFDDWWDRKRESFGPDDGVEFLDAESVERALVTESGVYLEIDVAPEYVELLS